MSEILLRIEGVSKRFPGVKALDDVTLDVYQGEVHAIVGENGAGKTTLMNILSGLIARDAGVILYNGQEFNVADPRYSQKIGIATVYQELALAQNLTIMDNVFLWNLPHWAPGMVDHKALSQKTTDLLEPLGIKLDPTTPVKRLSVSEKQLVEIAKALSRNASTIIMDEPNSALSPAETEFLFEIIRKLKSRGVTVLYISHRLDEVFQIADRITILRDGRLIDTVDKAATTIDQVVSMMVGRELKQKLDLRGSTQPQGPSDGTVLSVRGISHRKLFREVSFDLHRREILGVFGLVGAGRTQMAEALFGLRPIDSGAIHIDEQAAKIHSPYDAIALGMGFIPEDRKLSGLFMNMNVADNINMTSFDLVSRLGFVLQNKAIPQAKRMVQELDIRLSSLSQRIDSLSGGNQQKAILARWLMVSPKILILDEPTRGIDVGAKAQIYELINRLTEQGVAILLISSEMEEIMALSDRILVMRRGLISAKFDRTEATSDKLMLSAA